MKRASWNHVMAWTTVFAIFGTGWVWAGTNAWTRLGPHGGEIEALSVDPHNPRTLYVATGYGGAFKSLDGGASWVKSGVPNTPLVFDPQDPDTIYAIQPRDFQQPGIFKSTDGGTSWAGANAGIPAEPFVLRIDPLNSSTLYAGTVQGIFKSTDGGTNWRSANSGIPLFPFPDRAGLPRSASVHSLVIDPQTPSTLYAVADGLAHYGINGLTVDLAGGLFKSTDAGGSWNTLDLGLPQTHSISAVLAIDPQNPSTLYVGTVYGIFKSTDGGAGWNPVNSGLPPFATGLPPFPGGSPYFHADSVAIDPRQPDTVYAAITNWGLGSRIFKTTNGGASWSDAGSGLPEGTFVSSLQIVPHIPATLYAGTKAGVFKSTDGGTTWAAANSGLTAIMVSDVAIDPRNSSTLYAATSNGLVKSTDGGTNWSPPNSGVARFSSKLTIDPRNTSTVFAQACTAQLLGCGVFKSTDGGTSWSASWIDRDSNYNWNTALAIDPRNSNIVYAATTGEDCIMDTLRKSVDGGMSWSHSLFKDMGVLAFCVSDLVVDPRNSGNLYAAFQYGGVFKSTDAGATWNAANSGIPVSVSIYSTVARYNAVALAIDPGSPSTVYTVSSSGVFKSSDGGMSWNPASSGLPDWSSELEYCCFLPRLAVDPQNSARVYLAIAIARAHHVFQSSDGGASWTDFLVASGGCCASVGGLAIGSQGPSTVYAGTRQGVFAMTFTDFWIAASGEQGRRHVQIVEGRLVVNGQRLEIYGVLAAAAVDANLDGRMDLMVATREELLLLVARLDGTYDPAVKLARWPERVLAITNLLPGDWNGAGRWDVLLGSDTAVELWVAVRESGLERKFRVTGYRRPVEMDVNGDGMPDVLVERTAAGGKMESWVWIGTGAGRFVPVKRQQPEAKEAGAAGGELPRFASSSSVGVISAGMDHSLKLRTDGKVWAWGRNGDGQLGIGNAVESHMPVKVNVLTGVVALAGGGYHSLALKSDGTVWAGV